MLKRIKIAQAEGKNWQSETYSFLLMYRSTPHSTTGVSPAELPFNCKLRTKLPQLEMYCDYDFDVQKCIDNDAEMKEKRKMYADVKRNAVNDLQVGDKVLLKQNESNKMSTVFRKDPFIITKRKEICVIV